MGTPERTWTLTCRAWLLLCFILAFIGCSKHKSSTSESDPSQELRKLPVDSVWSIDSLEQGDTLDYRVSLEQGKKYEVQWDDSLDGSAIYSADVSIEASDSSGTLYWNGFVSNGYHVAQSVTAVDSVLNLRIAGVQAGRFAIRVVLAGSVQPNPGVSSSTIGSSASVVVDVRNGGILPVSRTWSVGHLAVMDTLLYTATLVKGKTYHVQWMDDFDFLPEELVNVGGVYPSIDVKVGAIDSASTVVFSPVSDGARSPQSFVALNSKLTLRVFPDLSVLDTGSFFIRLYTETLRFKSLAVSDVWTVDTLLGIGDTLHYVVPVSAGGVYSLQWDDVGEGTKIHTANIKVNASDFSVSTSDVRTTGYLDNWIDNGYLAPLNLVRSASYAWAHFDAVATTAGHFGIRFTTPSTSNYQLLPISADWSAQNLASSDTMYFKVPTIAGHQYQIQVDDAINGFGAMLADVKFATRSRGGVNWSTAQIGAFLTPVTYNATDSLYLRVVGRSVYSQGTYRIRVYEGVLPLTRSLVLDGPWMSDLLGSGDTISYKVLVSPSQTVQVQWDDQVQGSGAYTADIQVSSKTITGFWLSYIDNGYTAVVKRSSSSDTLYIKVIGANTTTAGSYAIRVRSWPQMKAIPISLNWYADTLMMGDSIYYFAAVTSGTTYRVEWLDEANDPSLADIKVTPVYPTPGSTGSFTPYWTRDVSDTLQQVKASSENMAIVVCGKTAQSTGAFSLHLYPMSYMKKTTILQPKSDWTLGTLQTFDTLLYKIPVTKDTPYRIQWDDADGSGIYTARVNVRASHTSGTLYFYYMQNGLNTDQIVVPDEDTVYVYVANVQANSRGTFTIRAVPVVPETVPIDLSSGNPISVYPSLSFGGMSVFRLTGLTLPSYQIQLSDATSDPWAYSAQIMFSTRLPSSSARLSFGYFSPWLFNPSGSELWVYVWPKTASSTGTYSMDFRPAP